MDNLIKKLISERETATYTFEHQILIPYDERHTAEHFSIDVKNFAFGIGIRHWSKLCYDEHSGLATTFVTFQIKHSQEFVLEKVAALFAFAATRKLRLCNQTFTPK